MAMHLPRHWNQLMENFRFQKGPLAKAYTLGSLASRSSYFRALALASYRPDLMQMEPGLPILPVNAERQNQSTPANFRKTGFGNFELPSNSNLLKTRLQGHFTHRPPPVDMRV
jgi:hypothetical protein